MLAQFTPNFDPLAAYPEAAALQTAMRVHDWSAARSALDKSTGTALTVLLRLGARLDRCEEFLRKVVDGDPDDLPAATMLARRLIDIGWGVRSGARAAQVSAAQFGAFHDLLRQAEQILTSVCARDPGFVPAWCERLPTARGLELGQAEARRRFDQLARHSPHHLSAQNDLLQQLCPKWSGDLEAMHAFAAECAAAAPPGSLNGALVVDAHVEHWLEIGRGTRYFRNPTVKDEIRAAGERSVLHPDFQKTPGWVHAMSLFALGYTLIGDWPSAKRCFIALGPFAHEAGWSYLIATDVEQAFRQNRARAMRRG